MAIIRRTLFVITGLLLLMYGGLVIYAYWPYPPGVPATDLADEQDRFVSVNGIRLRYRVWGEARVNQPTLVLIHGFANSVQTFRSLGPALAADHQLIALDMPGFGLSDKPADHDYSNAAQAEVVAGFIRELNLRNVIIGGHSMGGALALHVAKAVPDVIGMILLNPGIITTGVPAITEYLIFPLPRLTAKMFAGRDFRESFVKQSFVDPSIITEQVLDDLMLAGQTDDYITGATQLMKYYVAGNEEELLKETRVPTLIIWGVADRKPVGEEYLLLESLHTGRLIRVPEAGHYVHEEKPLAVAAAIREAKDFWGARR